VVTKSAEQGVPDRAAACAQFTAQAAAAIDKEKMIFMGRQRMAEMATYRIIYPNAAGFA
jgi:hypothetical protein